MGLVGGNNGIIIINFNTMNEENVTISITGARSGDAVYKIKIDGGELLMLKMGLADMEQKSKKKTSEN